MMSPHIFLCGGGYAGGLHRARCGKIAAGASESGAEIIATRSAWRISLRSFVAHYGKRFKRLHGHTRSSQPCGTHPMGRLDDGARIRTQVRLG